MPFVMPAQDTLLSMSLLFDSGYKEGWWSLLGLEIPRIPLFPAPPGSRSPLYSVCRILSMFMLLEFHLAILPPRLSCSLCRPDFCSDV